MAIHADGSDKYLLAAADQPSGPRASRLAQVIRAKFEAGLLKPYDYMKGYARMLRWMDSSTTGAVSAAPSRQNSPVKEPAELSGNGRVARVSPESRRRILAALAGFRPRFRQIARGLTDVDLVFIEEAFERLMLDYDRFLACKLTFPFGATDGSDPYTALHLATYRRNSKGEQGVCNAHRDPGRTSAIRSTVHLRAHG